MQEPLMGSGLVWRARMPADVVRHAAVLAHTCGRRNCCSMDFSAVADYARARPWICCRRRCCWQFRKSTQVDGKLPLVGTKLQAYVKFIMQKINHFMVLRYSPRLRYLQSSERQVVRSFIKAFAIASCSNDRFLLGFFVVANWRYTLRSKFFEGGPQVLL